MAIPTGRCYNRVAKEVLVEIARPDPALPKETAVSENISARGIRVCTEHGWRAGDYVLLSSAVTNDAAPARVVYCQRLENHKFAIGLELLAPAEPRKRSD
jgi:hypothetical protein